MKCSFCGTKVQDENLTRCPNCGGLLVPDDENIEKPEEIIPEVVADNVVEIDKYSYQPKRYLANILVYYAIMLFGASIIALIIQLFVLQVPGTLVDDQLTESAANIVNILTQIFTYIALFVCAFLILFKDVKNDTLRMTKNFKRVILTALIGFAAMYAVNIVLNIFYQIIHLQGDSQNQETIESMFHQSPIALKIIYAVVVSLLAPIVEELIFRKSLFGVFKKLKIKKIFIVLITGAIFGLMHISTAIITYAIQGDYGLIGPELLYGLNYISMGIIFGFVYYYAEENIYSSLILHIINNVISVIAIFLIS